MHPTFTADRTGDYSVQLTVTNSLGSPYVSQPSTVTISTTNSAPVADAGPDRTGSTGVIQVGSTVQLDGSHSYDPDGDPITYNWSFTSKPSGSTTSLVGASTATPTFVADADGTYVVQLVVSDPSTVQVEAISVLDNTFALIKDLTDTIGAMHDSVFRNPAMQDLLIHRLHDIMIDIERANDGVPFVKKQRLGLALRGLRGQIMRRVDGCAASGSADRDDWIIDCAAQKTVYDKLKAAIAEVEKLIAAAS